MKQILMVGAGSVGGFFGAHLAKANLSVSFLLRPKTLAAVNRMVSRSAVPMAPSPFIHRPRPIREISRNPT